MSNIAIKSALRHQAWTAVGHLERLSSAIERIGGQVPSRAIPYVYDFFDLADAFLLQEVKSITESDRKSNGLVVYPSSKDE